MVYGVRLTTPIHDMYRVYVMHEARRMWQVQTLQFMICHIGCCFGSSLPEDEETIMDQH